MDTYNDRADHTRPHEFTNAKGHAPDVEIKPTIRATRYQFRDGASIPPRDGPEPEPFEDEIRIAPIRTELGRACELAESGVRVVPVDRKTGKSLVLAEDATTDLQVIRKWWREFDHPIAVAVAIAQDNRTNYWTQEASASRKLSYFSEFGTGANKRPILKGLLYKGEISSLIGPPKSMKSALVAEIVVHCAALKDWRGHTCKEACGVMVFALERSQQYQRRFDAYRIRDNLPKLPIAIHAGVIDLLTPKCVEAIASIVHEAELHMGCKVGLIVVDTYSKGIAAGGGDENSARDQNYVAANLRRILERIDAHVMTVGHTGKDPTRGERGSNARLGDVDLQIQITANGKSRIAEVTDANDQSDRVIAQFESELFDLGHDEDGEVQTIAIISDVEVSGARASTTKPRLSAAQSRALELLTRCINDLGRPAPPSNEYPANVRVVSLDEWHTMCERGGLSSADKKPDRDRVFRRVKDELQTMHRIACLDGLVWLVLDFNGA